MVVLCVCDNVGWLDVVVNYVGILLCENGVL